MTDAETTTAPALDDEARIRFVTALRGAVDGADAKPLAEVVRESLEHTWAHGGREGRPSPAGSRSGSTFVPASYPPLSRPIGIPPRLG